MDGWITISYVQGRGRIMSQPRRPLDLYFPEMISGNSGASWRAPCSRERYPEISGDSGARNRAP